MAKMDDGSPDWDAELQVYEPHRAGLPALKPYFRDLFGRLEFAAEFSRAEVKASNSQTVFGQLWLVLNPLLLSLVYYILVNLLSGKSGGLSSLGHIVGGIFIFYYFSGSVATGAGSVTGGGRLILNMAFPRLLMPIAAVRTAFIRFLPTVPVYLVIRMLAGGKWTFTMLLGVVFLGFITLFNLGMAALMATVQVYFRDTMSFLPYFLRIWLYLSPILWFPEAAPKHFAKFMFLNPLYSLIGGWTDLTLLGKMPSPSVWVGAATWSVVALIGGSLVFLSRERDFAVRI